MESFAALATTAGEVETAAKWNAAASTQRSKTMQHMWDPFRRKFRNHIYVVRTRRSIQFVSGVYSSSWSCNRDPLEDSACRGHPSMVLTKKRSIIMVGPRWLSKQAY